MLFGCWVVCFIWRSAQPRLAMRRNVAVSVTRPIHLLLTSDIWQHIGHRSLKIVLPSTCFRTTLQSLSNTYPCTPSAKLELDIALQEFLIHPSHECSSLFQLVSRTSNNTTLLSSCESSFYTKVSAELELSTVSSSLAL